MHAAIQATLYNAHFETDGVPWSPEDLLGKGDRPERRKQKQMDRLSTFKFSRMANRGDAMIPEFIAELAKNRKPN
jgi:hypothetical protein